MPKTTMKKVIPRRKSIPKKLKKILQRVGPEEEELKENKSKKDSVILKNLNGWLNQVLQSNNWSKLILSKESLSCSFY